MTPLSPCLVILLLFTTPITPTPTPNPPPRAPQKRCAPPLYPQLRLGSSPQDASAAQNPPYTISLSSPTATDNATVNLGFVVPSDAVGPCSLMLSLPSTADVQGGPAQVNVVALDGPDPGGVVGTVWFSGSSGGVTINSFACREQMCYSLQVIAEDEGGDARWVEFVEGGGDGGGGGVYMTYGC